VGFLVDAPDGLAEGSPFGCLCLKGETDADELEGVGNEDGSDPLTTINILLHDLIRSNKPT